MMKKLIATALAAAMIFGLVSVGLAAAVFPDVDETTEYGNAIAKLKALGLVKGDDLGNYNPYQTITRAEFTAMLVRMLNLETAAGYLNSPTVFPDVLAQHAWAYGYINVATGRGLVKGFEDGTFRPGEAVTQAQALTMLLRALGYNDNLPGDWPIDYIMKGAELDMIEAGFVGGLGANRALVAQLVSNALDQAPVKEDKDALGTFVDKYAAGGVTLYEDVFGLKTAGKEQYVSGKVASVNTSDKKIKIGDVSYDYADGVAVFGKDGVADLVGQFVAATFNKAGKIIFVEVTTAGEVAGEITAIDTVNNKVTINGTAYSVLSDAEVYKNNEKLTDSTTIAGALVSINGSNAKLLLNSSGKVYRIDASKLDLAGSIAAKRSVVGSDGKVKYQLDVKDSKSVVTAYTLTSSTVLVRNGVTATFADIKKDDDVKFSAKSDNTLLYLDAWQNLVEGYKVTSVAATSAGRTVTAVKDGVETTFVVHKDYKAVINVNDVYNFGLNRDGKIISATLTKVEGPVVSKVKTITGKDQVWNATTPGVDYRIHLDDESVLVLNAITIEAFSKNGLVETLGYVDVWNALSANDLIRVEDVDKNGKYEIYAYNAKISGLTVREGSAPAEYSVYKDTYKKAVAVTSWDTEVTLNGKRVLNTSPALQTAPGNALYTITVTFTGTDSSDVPIAKAVALEKLANVAYTVAGVTTEGDEYTFKLDNNAGYVYLVADEDTIVVKDGEKVTAADIEIGDLLQAGADFSDTTAQAYIKATTPEDAPEIDANASSAVWTAADPSTTPPTDSKLVVTVKVNEGCKSAYVYVGGTRYTASRDGVSGTWKATIEGLAAKPAKVTVVAVNYAGLVSDTADISVTP
jgi:hypothetical protein